MLSAILNTLCSISGVLKLGAAVGIKNCASLIYNVGDVSYVHGTDIVLDESRITAVDSHNLYSTSQGSTNNRSYRRIHSGCITARGKHANTFNTFHFTFISPCEKIFT